MSRIGKKPIQIPEDVKIEIKGNVVIVKGPKGELQMEFQPDFKLDLKDNQLIVIPFKETKKTKSLWGLTRTLISNMVEGVKNGYEKKLELQGIGYRAILEKEDLVLYVGFSHPVKFKKPEGIKFSVEKNIITVLGIDKQLVGQTAAEIRAIRPPEPYKGKGIRYQGETVRKKAGKKAVAAKE